MTRQRGNWSSSRVGRRRLLGGALAGGAGLAFLAACGRGAGPEGGASSQVAPATTRVASTEDPAPGGTLRYVTLAPPSAFDPYLNPSYTAQEPWGYISNRILKYKAGPEYTPDDQTLEPDVAAAMPEIPDPTKVIVKLRKDVKFHDRPPVNGRSMVAQDVTFSIDRYLAVGQAKNMFEAMDKYEATDDATIVFTLKRPTASFVNFLAAHALLWIIPKEVPAADGKVSPQGPFVGAGPFMFGGYETDVKTSFLRNPAYYRKGQPYVDRVERPIMADVATQDANFRSGNLSFHPGIVEKNRVAELARAVPGSTQYKYATTAGPHIEMAMDRPPFDDVRVRRAFSMAINRDEIGAGLGFIDWEYCSPAFPASYKPYYLDPKSSEYGEHAKWFKYDPEGAKKLLTDAGYPTGFTVPYNYTHEYAYGKEMGELLFSQLEKVGIKLRLQQFTYVDYQNRFKVGDLAKRRYDGLVDDRPASQADPSGWFTTYWGPRATRALSVWEDAQFLDLIDKQDRELDFQKRVKLFADIQRHMAGGMPGVPLLTESGIIAIQPNVRNLFYKQNYGRASETDLLVWLAKK